jgi:hypothetical protein
MKLRKSIATSVLLFSFSFFGQISPCGHPKKKKKKNLVNGLKEIWPLDLVKALGFDNRKGCYRHPTHAWLGLGFTQCK